MPQRNRNDMNPWKEILQPDFLSNAIAHSQIIENLTSLIHYFIVNLAGPPVAIISVEKMISANHLVTAGAFATAGEIIALFTKAMSLMNACWEAFKNWFSHKERSMSSETFPLSVARSRVLRCPQKRP
ncbi:hypothetical protein BCR34DRAFT_594725 [Clohesyomyces aquaticus]|uniref:Uncharacterized protein n=1 Tax=Clohesyomyces aquaticus TaxID=1231657 RepID=A0A1Y1Y5N4_9PLEO|nr:hypothetical protein BCR34DRAFT_594725 [Clohesyomyces aquaticus]